MSRGRTMVEAQATEGPSAAADDAAPLDTGFGAEFRELARQRRFVRSADEAQGAADDDWRTRAARPAESGTPSWRANAPAPSPQRRVAPLPSTPPPARVVAEPGAVAPVGRRGARRAMDDRISQDQRATLLELARMSDRLVESREQLAAAITQSQQLEQQLAVSEQRLMASRLLVQDAQRAAHQVAERCAWLEARCETLQDALELAVNASWLTRWKWRREQRARRRDAHRA